MIIDTNRFKRALASRTEKLAGFWLTTASPTATEIASGAGFDWLLIDMEHSANDIAEIVDHLRAATGGTAEAMVRVPWNEPVMVKRLLDSGVRSLLFPYVESVEEAKAAVAATRYPPLGIRGHSAVNRATNYGRWMDYNETYADDIVVIVQVETERALAAAGAIAAVDGIDGVFIGPGDLSANMGRIGQGWRSPDVRKLGLDGLKAIKGAGKAAGTLIYDETIAKELFGLGFDFIAVGSDAVTLARGVDRIAAAYKTA